jgi:hypothetical protein
MSAPPLPVCRAAELDEPEADHRWLVEPLWSRSAVGFIAALPKLGKTWLGLDLALSVASNTPCLGRFPVQESGPTLVYLAEDHTSEVRQRLSGICRHRGLSLHKLPLYVITVPSLRLDLERDRERLARTVQQIRPRLLLLDPLVRLHRRDENHAGDVSELLAFLRQLQREHDLAILVVHHLRKNGGPQPGQALRGSGDFHAWTDSALYLHAHRNRIQLHAEHRSAPAPAPVEIQLVSRPDGSATHLESVARSTPVDAPPVPLAQSLTRLLEESPRPVARVELRRRLRVNNQRLGATLVELEGQGLIARTQAGWRAKAPRLPGG